MAAKRHTNTGNDGKAISSRARILMSGMGFFRRKRRIRAVFAGAALAPLCQIGFFPTRILQSKFSCHAGMMPPSRPPRQTRFMEDGSFSAMPRGCRVRHRPRPKSGTETGAPPAATEMEDSSMTLLHAAAS